MTWLLVLVLIYADGTSSVNEVPGFQSATACEEAGRAWLGMVNRGERPVMPLYHCRSPRRATP